MARPIDPRVGRTYRPAVKTPCNDCPFRRNAAPGWLGAATPESFVECIQREEPLPCHQTIDYGDKRWKAQWTAAQVGKTCAGALILSANMAKLPRDRNFPRLPADGATVFTTPTEFIAYHRAAKVRSWEFGGDDDEAS